MDPVSFKWGNWDIFDCLQNELGFKTTSLWSKVMLLNPAREAEDNFRTLPREVCLLRSRRDVFFSFFLQQKFLPSLLWSRSTPLTMEYSCIIYSTKLSCFMGIGILISTKSNSRHFLNESQSSTKKCLPETNTFKLKTSWRELVELHTSKHPIFNCFLKLPVQFCIFTSQEKNRLLITSRKIIK